MATRRRRILGVSSIAVVVALGVVVGVNQWRANSVHLPLRDDSARQVLGIYLQASKDHDCDLTNALAYDEQEREGSWCGGNWLNPDENPTLLAYKNFGKPAFVPASESEYGSEECITVDIWQKGANGLSPGKVPGWGFCLHHTAHGWRVAEEGYG